MNNFMLKFFFNCFDKIYKQNKDHPLKLKIFTDYTVFKSNNIRNVYCIVQEKVGECGVAEEIEGRYCGRESSIILIVLLNSSQSGTR